jgi:hypothetical protein
VRIIEQGILNPGIPGGQRAISTRPSLTVVNDQTLLASYRVGTTKSCDDESVELRWSADAGRTWSKPVSPFASTVNGVKGSLTQCMVTSLGAERLIGAALWINREAFPGKPLFNPETEGCLPISILVADSQDSGHSWSGWRVVPMPAEIGPPSLTSPILRFADATLALSVETNKNYEDTSAWHQRVVYLRSADQGKTWSGPETISEDETHQIFYWDQRAGVAPDGTLVTFSWTYDRRANAYLNVRRNISRDRGRSWLGFEDLGFSDQPSHPAILADGRVVVAWVDRFGTSSIRARVAAAIDAPFPEASEVVLYEHGREEASGEGTGELLVEMGRWSYGLPYAEALPNGEVLVAYYAGTDRCMDSRWARLKV